MKKASSASHIKYAVTFGLIGLLGCGGLYFSYSSLQQTQEELMATLKKIVANRPENIMPSKKNLDAATENLEEVDKIVSASVPALIAKSSMFDPVRNPSDKNKGLDPESWKRLMNSKLNDLNKMAAENKVHLPGDFYFGFRSYRVSTPIQESTAPLGIQLMAIEEIGKILISSKISSIENVRRAWAQVGDNVQVPNLGGGGGSSLASEIFPELHIEDGDYELYTDYPFEVEFKTHAENLRKVINSLMKSDFFFVIKNIQVLNEKQTLPTQVQLETALGVPVDDGTRISTGPNGMVATGPGVMKNFIVVAGQELVTVKMRIDLLFWSDLPHDSNSKKTTEKSTAKGRKK